MSAPATTSAPDTPPPEEEADECDQALRTALKKLKMDSECTCAVTKEEGSHAPLKHKHDPSMAPVVKEEQPDDDESVWSRPLQELCLCDHRAGASDETSIKSCTCSRLRWQKTKASAVRNSLNLAHAAGVRKPILREARLKFPVGEKNKQMLRASRLRITNRASVNKEFAAASASSVFALRTNTTTSLSSSSICTSSSTHSQDKPTAGSSTSQSRAAFTSASLHDHASFSSLSSPLEKENNDRDRPTETLPQFDEYRDTLQPPSVFTGRSDQVQAPASFVGASAGSVSVPDSPTSPPVAMPSTARLDLTMERSCSQEARLDEMSVNELAAYFDEFIHIPKKMSSMAEMMYT